MVFSSTEFLFLFLPLVLVLYYNPFFKNWIYRNVLLFVASIGFYAWGEPVFVFLMLFSILVTYIFGLWLSGRKSHKGKTCVLMLGVAYHVTILTVFKYLSFLLAQLGSVFHLQNLMVAIPLPIGISFFTFQMMSYLFDIYYGKAAAQKNILYVGLYVAFFPQLIAGPIVRYDQIVKQLQKRHTTFSNLSYGMVRFVQGLGKKVLLANYLAVIADNIFDVHVPMGCAVLTAWLGAVAYTLQIYFDFSGYSDMAIGLGSMFGFSFPENFRYPYAARSVADFWRRWHISLSSWFRDYVYIPLGGNRVAKKRWVLNLFLVWLLTGIWHGANWTFPVWGLLYFLLLLLEKTTRFPERLRLFSHGYTMLSVCLAWVIFRSENLMAAIRYMGVMFGIGATSFVDGVFKDYALHGGAVILTLSAAFALPVISVLQRRFQEKLLDMTFLVGWLIVFALSLLVIVGGSYNPFIYFNF